MTNCSFAVTNGPVTIVLIGSRYAKLPLALHLVCGIGLFDGRKGLPVKRQFTVHQPSDTIASTGKVHQRGNTMGASNYILEEAALMIAVLVSTVTAISSEDRPSVPFPEGYRSWQHVKSIVIGPEHPIFARRGGIHHYYANPQAVRGYASGNFPDGSIIVDEGLLTRDGEGPAKGIVMEGDRRFLEVMVKGERRYSGTGGWGFERFERDEKTGHLTQSEQAQCHECHANAKEHDQVFSRIRP